MIIEFKPYMVNNIMEIWLETNIDAHDFIPKEYWINNYEAVKNTLSSAEILAYEDTIIKGFIGIIDKSYIAGLFVSKQFQGSDIGKELIEECKKRYSSLALDVYLKNSKAVEFYQKCDFKIHQVKMNHDTKEKEYTMLWKRLQG